MSYAAAKNNYADLIREDNGVLRSSVTPSQVTEVENYLTNFFSPGDKVEGTYVYRDGFGGGPLGFKTVTGTIQSMVWINKFEPSFHVAIDGKKATILLEGSLLTKV